MFMQSSPTPTSACTRRRGSVLIMVIAVLVLMALIGTAYVSIARIDRQGAATGSANTQMTLGAASVAQQTESMILNGLFAYYASGDFYRPAVDNTNNNINIQSTFAQDPAAVYHDYDSFYDEHDGWLASRVPQPADVTNAASTSNVVVWPSISLLQSAPFSTPPYKVDTPYSSLSALPVLSTQWNSNNHQG